MCSCQEVSLCLVSQVTLRSSTSASSIDCLAKSHAFHHITYCLSQAYSCSDRYNEDRMLLSTSLQFFSTLSVVSTTSPYLHNQSTSNRSSTLLHSSYPCYFFSISPFTQTTGLKSLKSHPSFSSPLLWKSHEGPEQLPGVLTSRGICTIRYSLL